MKRLWLSEIKYSKSFFKANERASEQVWLSDRVSQFQSMMQKFEMCTFCTYYCVSSNPRIATGPLIYLKDKILYYFEYCPCTFPDTLWEYWQRNESFNHLNRCSNRIKKFLYNTDWNWLNSNEQKKYQISSTIKIKIKTDKKNWQSKVSYSQQYGPCALVIFVLFFENGLRLHIFGLQDMKQVDTPWFQRLRLFLLFHTTNDSFTCDVCLVLTTLYKCLTEMRWNETKWNEYDVSF